MWPWRKPPLANFVVAGATRSGTTSLWHYLRQHPDIFLPEAKELWFFNVDETFAGGTDRYRRMFRGWTGQPAVGDITPIYLSTGLLYRKARHTPYVSSEDSAIARIRRTIPDARIVLTLRHPVDRLLSQYQKNFFQGKDTVAPSLDEHVERDLNGASPPAANFIEANRYERHLAHVLKYFARDCIHLMIFEEWTRTPESALVDLFRFLGVRQEAPVATRDVLNTSLSFQEKSGRAAGDATHVPKMSPALRRRLIDILARDVAAVEQFAGRRVHCWHADTLPIPDGAGT